MIAAETYWTLFTNVPHWLFELTVEAVSGLLLTPLFRWAWRRHDREVHQVEKKGHGRRGAGAHRRTEKDLNEEVRDGTCSLQGCCNGSVRLRAIGPDRGALAHHHEDGASTPILQDVPDDRVGGPRGPDVPPAIREESGEQVVLPVQTSLTEQVTRLHLLAVKHGLYDADDWLLRTFPFGRVITKIEED